MGDLDVDVRVVLGGGCENRLGDGFYPAQGTS